MPARRLPWFKLWPEAMRHEKIVLLSDSTFRTWIVVLAAGSEQAVRWRFASIKHVVSVTGRPARHIHELIRARLIDEDESGELWVHDWRQWQDRYESDFAPRTLLEDSANAPNKLRAEGEKEKEQEQDGDTPTPQPPPASGKGSAAGAADDKRRGRRNGAAHHDEPAQSDAELTPATPGDVAVWNQARAELVDGWSPANAEKLEAFEPLGRAADGGLHLRAPPGANGPSYRHQVARALGDAAGPSVVIVEG
jgi:hypothetical protein